ncbi:hypothetical protein NQ315_015280, partial [Exocentrus adspersus]
NLLLLACGAALTWSSPELPKLLDPATTPFRRTISPQESSWISSIITLGASIGPFLFGFVADKIGRKSTLLYLGLPFLICQPLLAFSTDTGAFLAARFVIGLAVGGTFIVMPMYIGEISDKDNRGAMAASMSCFVCFGIFFSCSVGPYVSVTTFNLVLAVFPALFLVMFFVSAPESPHFHVRVQESTTLAPEICTTVIVGVQFLSSFLTPLIIDRFGRKLILLFSAFFMVASEVPLGVYFHLKNNHVDVDGISFLPIVTLTTFIVAFNVGFGPIPWAMLCELFPSEVKSTASALVSSFIWIMAFCLTKYFECLVTAFGMDVLFLFFACCCMLGAMLDMLIFK